MLNWLPTLVSIILIDLALSGDNALVIGAVAARIPAKQRWIAFLGGGGGAIVLRIVLTYSITLTLQIPYIETIGGLCLLAITIKMLVERTTPHLDDPHKEASKEASLKVQKKYIRSDSIFGAILTILIADATMSLDNIIAIAALAKQQTILLIVGLFISIFFLMVGSVLIAFLIERLPWLMLIAGGILTFTAANMVARTTDIFNILPNELPWWSPVVYSIAFASIIYPCYLWVRHHPATQPLRPSM